MPPDMLVVIHPEATLPGAGVIDPPFVVTVNDTGNPVLDTKVTGILSVAAVVGSV